MDPFKTKSFKTLQAKWYKKLKNSGFEDIETDGTHLKWSTNQNLTRSLNRGREIVHESKADYFRLAGYFVYDHIFETEIDSTVWKMHAEGVPIREIAKHLNAKAVKISPTTVKLIIHRLKKLMFSKYKELDNE